MAISLANVQADSAPSTSGVAATGEQANAIDVTALGEDLLPDVLVQA